MNTLFQKRRWRILIPLIDALGNLFIKPWLNQGPFPSSPHKILLVRLDHLGDVVMSLPVIHAIKSKFPSSEVWFLTGSQPALLLSKIKEINGVIAYDAPWFERKEGAKKSLGKVISEHRSLIKKLRAEHFDLAIDLRGDIRHACLLWVSGVKYRIGYGVRGGGFLFNNVPVYPKDLHEVVKNLSLISADTLKNKPVFPLVRIGDEARERVSQLLSSRHLDPKKKQWVVLHPHAGASSKRWQIEKFSAVANRLNERFAGRVAFIGSGEARDYTREILARMKNPAHDFLDQFSLEELAAFFERSALVVSTDSGPAHLAALLRIPVFLIFSAAHDPKVWAPYADKVDWVVKTPPCAPCERADCLFHNHPCMTEMDIDEVYDCLSAFIEKSGIA